MDFNIDVRKKQLQSLDQYITSSKDKVQSILDYLGWNTKKIMEKEAQVTCSINPSHIVAMTNAEVHFKKCFVKSSGYQSEEEFLSEPINNPSTSLKIDQAKKIEILSKARESNQRFKAAWNGQDADPMTSDRLFTTFSTDERLVLYDYSIQNTEHPPVPSEFNIQIEDKKEEQFLTAEEFLAIKRDSKRRRIKYKSVHTSRNKSYTEVIKEVIDNQMEQYKDYLASKEELNATETNADMDQSSNERNLYNSSTDTDMFKKDNIERPSSSVSRHSNHSSSSRNKKDYIKHEKSYKNHNHDADYRKDKDCDKRHSNKYDHSSYKENRRHKDFEEDYRHSRDKREWYHKSERRH